MEDIALTRIGFGVNFMPSAPVREVVEWAKAVERHGYDPLGISDSQSISRDVYVTLAHCASATLPKMATLAERYVFGEHARPGSANCRLITELGLVDYLADRFAVVGTPAECVKKLERAIEAGARQFWMSIHFDDRFRLIRDFAEQVMPAFRRSG